jgi:hypothetical protein
MQNNLPMEIPKDAVYTMIVSLDGKGKKATFHLKELTEDIYLACRDLIDKGKDFAAVKMMLKDLHVGGDPINVLDNNFRAIQCARKMVSQFLEPLEGELKKN